MHTVSCFLFQGFERSDVCTRQLLQADFGYPLSAHLLSSSESFLSALHAAAKFSQDISTEVPFSSQEIPSRSECPRAGTHHSLATSTEAPSSSQEMNSRRECPGARTDQSGLQCRCIFKEHAYALSPALMLCTAMARFMLLQ